MKKTSLLAVALAPFVLGFSLANAQTSVTTDPVGFVKLDLQPGLQTIGLPMVQSAVAAGAVASNDGSSITLEGQVDALGSGAHFVEVTAGPADAALVGERFEVSGASGSTISIDAGSARNTISLADVNLTGYNVVVRPHVTLAEAFPPADLQVNDQVLVFNPATGGFDTYTLTADIFGGAPSWQRGGANQNGLVLAPGQGAFYRNSSSSATSVVNLGEVRVNSFRQPLSAGLSQISEGHPVDNSPQSRVMTQDQGFEVNDQILVFNASTGGFDTYTYTADIFGGAPSWQRGGTNHNASELFQANQSVFVRKASADPFYEAPANF